MSESFQQRDKNIVSTIKNNMFNKYKKYMQEYYSALLNCSQTLRNVNSYYECLNRISQQQNNYQQTLKNKLDLFEKQYRIHVKKCNQQKQCESKQLQYMFNNVTNIYEQFYRSAIFMS